MNPRTIPELNDAIDAEVERLQCGPCETRWCPATGADPVHTRAALEVVYLRLKAMASAGSLGLGPKLEKVRFERLIPDGAFAAATLYDRVYVWQISDDESDTFGNGLIAKPEAVKDAERRTAPRGVVIGAGLLALDQLTSNGTELGDVVRIARNIPWSMRVSVVGGKNESVLILRSGDLTGNETLAERLRSGELKIERVWTGGTVTHVLKNKAGEVFVPELPFIGDDF